jgi:hypothetical protein
MDKYKVMENVANGLLAAAKVQQMYNNETRAHTSPQPGPQLGEVLGVIADHSPQVYRNSLSNTVSACIDYTNTYRNLKRNFALANSRGLNPDTMLNALGELRPVVNNRGKVLITKVLQIYEILKS